MENKKQITTGKEEHSVGQIVIENIIIAVNIALGVWALWDLPLINIPIISIVYFVYVLFMLLIFLRKHLCTHCYYYGKACHCGWGKIARVFTQNSGDINKAKKTAGAACGVVMVFPILGTILLMILGFNPTRIYQLAGLIILLIIQVIIHKKDCASCKMRISCPGAM